MRINNNSIAFNAYKNVSVTEVGLGKSLEKLSSGFRINRAADDAAGLVVSQKLRASVSALQVATRNAQDGISVVQTAEGALSEVSNMVQRIHDLCVQVSGSQDDEEKAAAKAEADALVDQIGKIKDGTSFGDSTVVLLDGTYSRDYQVGTSSATTISVAIADLTDALSTVLGGSFDVTTADADDIATDVKQLAQARGDLGALQNQFESTIANLQTTTENLSASESRIRDTDMASEMVNFTRHQILLQAGTAMLAQANQLPQATLRLFQ